MTIAKKRSQEAEVTNVDQNDILEAENIDQSETVEAGLIDDLKNKLSGKGEGGFFKSLLQSRRRIDTKSENKYKGNIVYEIDMCLLDDEGEVTVRVPAELRLEQATSTTTDEDGDEVISPTGNINMYLKLPDKNYSENKELNDVDTSGENYQNIPNSKEQVGIKCWKLFNELEYSKDDDFLKQFATEKVNPDEADFDSRNVKTITFESEDPETGEEKEFQFKAIVEVVNKERTKVNISFVYPNPQSLDDSESNWWENEDQYTNIDNDESKIEDRIVQFCEEKYGVSPSTWTKPLTASQSLKFESIMSTKTMRIQLQKVESSDGSAIELTAINATYNPIEAMEDVNLILEEIDLDKDFPNGTDVVVYDVSTNDDEVEYNIVENTSDEENDYIECSIDNILNCEYILYLNAKHMSYTACGKEMNIIQNSVDSYSWRAQEQIDILNKLLVEYEICPINPVLRIQGLDPNHCYSNDKTYLEDFINKVTEDITCLITALNLYICNLPESVQPLIEEFIRGWSYELNYTLKRYTL